MEEILRALAKDLKERGGLDLEECYIDGTFILRKRGFGVGKTKLGKGSKLMAMAESAGLPISVCVTSASPHEMKLVEETIEANFAPGKPKRLIGGRPGL
jgi:hypothetical protein